MSEQESARRERPFKPGDKMKERGGLLVGFCALCLLFGGAVVTIFFPEMKGKGLTPGALIVLVPIWGMGAVGAVLWLVGWIQSKST